ncbi:extracellular solute-binding protein [Nakamurella sp. YIM 132087]|uniref:Extracellular solute-binding protein n=1 Tax=Nakamurella alba TaxID=2665158 RepID=A0A7K1FKH7_9ACTN|nr:extracellular solute-binding protein [Nakamurella alba]MTD13364.1 extracellular solute-binding protein [Nakamurella alba]
MKPNPLFQRPISRRTLLRAGGTLAAAGLAAPLLAACGSDDSGGGSGTATSGGGGGGGGTIKLGIVQAWVEPIQPTIDAFTKESGVKVEIVPLSGSSGVELIQQFTPGFVSGKPAVDVMVISDEATPGFVKAGWLEPLDDIGNAEYWSDFPTFVKDYADTWSSQDGKIYRLPTSFTICLYVVRQDVLTELKADVPASWDDLKALGEKAKSKNMFAFGDALSKPALASVDAAWLSLQGGGQVFDFDAGTKAAFEFANDMLTTGYMPKDGLAWTYDQSNAAYTGDSLLSMRQWDYFLSVSAGTTPWYSPDKVVVVPPPAGTGGQAATYGGGWGLAVPAAGENKDNAKAFVAYMTGKDQAVALASAKNSQFSVIRNTTLDALPDRPQYIALADYNKANVVKPRPFHPKINEAQGILDDMYTGYLSGQLSIDEAMSNGASQIKALG